MLIREPDDELTRRVKSIISNVQREDVGPVEMAEALQALLDEDQRVKTQDDLAKTIGKDKTWVSGMLRILTLPVTLQQKVGSTQLSVSYDAMIRIARLEDAITRSNSSSNCSPAPARRKSAKRSIGSRESPPKSATSASSSKPKRVYRTKYKATVIVQSQTSRLTTDQTIDALQEALGQATKS